MAHNIQEKEAEQVSTDKGTNQQNVCMYIQIPGPPAATACSPACPPPPTQSPQATFLPLRADPGAPLSAKPEPWPVNPWPSLAVTPSSILLPLPAPHPQALAGVPRWHTFPSRCHTTHTPTPASAGGPSTQGFSTGSSCFASPQKTPVRDPSNTGLVPRIYKVLLRTGKKSTDHPEENGQDHSPHGGELSSQETCKCSRS